MSGNNRRQNPGLFGRISKWFQDQSFQYRVQTTFGRRDANIRAYMSHQDEAFRQIEAMGHNPVDTELLKYQHRNDEQQLYNNMYDQGTTRSLPRFRAHEDIGEALGEINALSIERSDMPVAQLDAMARSGGSGIGAFFGRLFSGRMRASAREQGLRDFERWNTGAFFEESAAKEVIRLEGSRDDVLNHGMSLADAKENRNVPVPITGIKDTARGILTATGVRLGILHVAEVVEAPPPQQAVMENAPAPEMQQAVIEEVQQPQRVVVENIQDRPHIDVGVEITSEQPQQVIVEEAPQPQRAVVIDPGPQMQYAVMEDMPPPQHAVTIEEAPQPQHAVTIEEAPQPQRAVIIEPAPEMQHAIMEDMPQPQHAVKIDVSEQFTASKKPEQPQKESPKQEAEKTNDGPSMGSKK